MSTWVVSLIFSLGATAWIYNQMMRRTGGNTQSALMSAVGSGLLIFLVFYLILRMIEDLLA